jgi:hypothetical protein
MKIFDTYLFFILFLSRTQVLKAFNAENMTVNEPLYESYAPVPMGE